MAKEKPTTPPGAPAAPTVPESPAPAAAASASAGAGTRRARVSVPNTHVGQIEVEIPADAENPQAAAIEAAKAARGIVTFGAGPVVEFLDEASPP